MIDTAFVLHWFIKCFGNKFHLIIIDHISGVQITDHRLNVAAERGAQVPLCRGRAIGRFPRVGTALDTAFALHSFYHLKLTRLR